MKILDVAAATVGGWFAVDRPAGATHVPVSVDVTAPATVTLEGRVDGESIAQVIKSGIAADEGVVAAWFPQMRATQVGTGSARVYVGAEGRPA